MNDWQREVVAERDDLDARLSRLLQRLKGSGEMDERDRVLLTAQADAMAQYLYILNTRIERWEATNEQ